MLDRHFIFFPSKDLIATPADVGLDFEEVVFPASDGVKLHGWYVPGEGDTTLLWFHGNAGNVSHRVDYLLRLHRHLAASVFIFDYRGYGRSEGSVSEEGTYLDAEGALAYLRSPQGPAPSHRLVLLGRSLGCAVAVEMATRHQVDAMILEAPFTSIRGMAKLAYPYLPAGAVLRLFNARYDSLSKIRNIHIPLLVMHGELDEIIPFEAGRELFDAANEPKRFHTIPGAGHNDTYLVGGDAYYDAIRGFLQDLGAVGR